MKQCFKCDEIKPHNEFYKHPQMADGHLNKCKPCTKRDKKYYRLKNIEHYRAYDRAYGRAHGNRIPPEYQREYRASKPNGYKAKNAINNGLRCRKLTKPVLCQYCGIYAPLHGHHRDYNKPLDVQWLCAPCHARWHVKYGEGLNP